MRFNPHLNQQGKHAFLGASKYNWLNYSDDKLIQVFINMQAKERGTRIHALASELISLGVKLPSRKKTLNMYVNDAIGFGMTPEQVLYYSDYCFGTADAIIFDERKKMLRIHDLKTGVTEAHIEQLEIYAALFYLEYGEWVRFTPNDENTELRIYQNDQILVHHPESSDILDIADKIVKFSKMLEEIDKEN